MNQRALKPASLMLWCSPVIELSPIEAEALPAKSSLLTVIYSWYKRCRWQQLVPTFCYGTVFLLQINTIHILPLQVFSWSFFTGLCLSRVELIIIFLFLFLLVISDTPAISCYKWKARGQHLHYCWDIR